jgi:hypothetical protein
VAAEPVVDAERGTGAGCGVAGVQLAAMITHSTAQTKPAPQLRALLIRSSGLFLDRAMLQPGVRQTANQLIGLGIRALVLVELCETASSSCPR